MQDTFENNPALTGIRKTYDRLSLVKRQIIALLGVALGCAFFLTIAISLTWGSKTAQSASGLIILPIIMLMAFYIVNDFRENAQKVKTELATNQQTAADATS